MDEVMTTTLLDRLLHHAAVSFLSVRGFVSHLNEEGGLTPLGGEYYLPNRWRITLAISKRWEHHLYSDLRPCHRASDGHACRSK